MALQAGEPRRPQRAFRPQVLVAVNAVEIRHLSDLDGPVSLGLSLMAGGADFGGRLEAVDTGGVTHHALDLLPLGVYLVAGGLRHLGPDGVSTFVTGGAPLRGYLRVLAYALRMSEREDDHLTC